MLFQGNVLFANGEERYQGDRVLYLEKSGLITMEGHVFIIRDGYEMQAERLLFYSRTGVTEMEGNVRVKGETMSVASRKALIREDGEMNFMEDVVFESGSYVGLADTLTVGKSQKRVRLEGIPYLAMEGRYIGGDEMDIALEEGSRITSLVITGHGDMMWTGEEQTIHLRSRNLSLFFGEENRLDLILARGDVRGSLETGENVNHFHGRAMDVRFSDNEPEEILLTGEAGGSATGLTAGEKEENHVSE